MFFDSAPFGLFHGRTSGRLPVNPKMPVKHKGIAGNSGASRIRKGEFDEKVFNY